MDVSPPGQHSWEETTTGSSEDDGHRLMMNMSTPGVLMGAMKAPQGFWERTRERRTLLLASAACALGVVIVALVFVSYSHRAPPSTSGAEYNFPMHGTVTATGRAGAVAADSPVCSELGTTILRRGGNAADAAVTTALCLGAINSFGSGIGGGGFATVFTAAHDAAKARHEAIDFRETAPAAADASMYTDPSDSQEGGLAVGVPGELRGLELLHQRHGRLGWSQVVTPVVALCRDGFEVSELLASRIRSKERHIMAHAPFRDVYAPHGAPLAAGERCYRPGLAETLERVAADGADAFYTGEIAQAIVDTVQGAGGVMTLEDLAGYEPEIRETVTTFYQGRQVLTVPAPGSGPVLIAMLNTLEGYNFRATGDTETNLGRTIESMKFAYAARSHLGDPDYNNITRVANELLSKEHAALLRSKIVADTTFPTEYYGHAFDMEPTPGTTHLSVVDGEGNAVALTTTINLTFGAKLPTPRWGIWLNNEIDDFAFPGFPNYFGVPPSPFNRLHPGARPLSSTCPTVVLEDGRVRMVVGASGGTKITTNTLQVMLRVLAFQMPLGPAVAAPRLHHQLLPRELKWEENYDPARVAWLGDHVGYHTVAVDEPLAIVQAIVRDSDGLLHAVSDWRKGSVASAV